MIGRALDKDRIRALIPHAGAMCLLDRVEQWSTEQIRCTTQTHLDVENPLRLGGALAALHLVEYGAQAAALHGALLASTAGGAPVGGMLAAIRNLALAVERIDTRAAKLTILATRRLVRDDGLLYDFEASCAGATLASGRLAISLGNR